MDGLLQRKEDTLERKRKKEKERERKKIYFAVVRVVHLFAILTRECTVEIFGWGGGGGGRGCDAFKILSPLREIFAFTHPFLKCFWKDSLMTAHHSTSSIFHCYPLPIHHPCPPKNFYRTQAHPQTFSPELLSTGEVQFAIKNLHVPTFRKLTVCKGLYW